MSCADCQKFLYDEHWQQQRDSQGEPYRRPLNTSPPCDRCPKIPPDSVPKGEKPAPRHAIELSDKNYRFSRFYWEVQAGAPMGDCPVTRLLCGWLHWTLVHAKEQREAKRNDWRGFVAALGASGLGLGRK